MPEDLDVAISEIENGGTAETDDLVLASREQGDGSWVSRSLSMADIALALLNVFQFEELETEVKTPLGAINELSRKTRSSLSYVSIGSSLVRTEAGEQGKVDIPEEYQDCSSFLIVVTLVDGGDFPQITRVVRSSPEGRERTEFTYYYDSSYYLSTVAAVYPDRVLFSGPWTTGKNGNQTITPQMVNFEVFAMT